MIFLCESNDVIKEKDKYYNNKNPNMENLSISIYLGGKVMDNMKEMRNIESPVATSDSTMLR